MTYAERFKVGAWLEEPAKWLSWAIDTASSPKDQAWNLQQFWQALALRKSSSLSTQQWGEVLLLDSRGQSTLGGYYLIQAADKAKAAAVYSVDGAWAKSFVLSVVGLGAAALLPKVREFLARNDPALKAYQASIKDLYDKAQEAFGKASQMAEQSKKALASTNATMAARAQTQAKSGQVITQNSRGPTEQMVMETAINAGPQFDLGKTFTASLGGIPVWGWLVGIGALALVITMAPTVVSVSRARRLVE